MSIFDYEKISFLKALDALIDYHDKTRAKNMATTTVPAVTAKKQNRFVSFLDHVGHDLKVGLPIAVKVAETAGETAVSIFAPGASALFNQTVSMIASAEQNYPSAGTGAQKSQAVVSIMGNLIQQGLKDAGLPNDAAAVQKYIDAAVLISKVATVAVPLAEAVAAPTPMAIVNGQPIAAPAPETAPATGPVIVAGPSAASSILG